MREIKFRGKSLQTGEWVYGYYAVFFLRADCGPIENSQWVEYHSIFTNEPGVSYSKGGGHWCTVDPDTVGQFTELYDTACREIYDGDIIGHGLVRGEVLYRNGSPCIKDYGDTVIRPLYGGAGSEVIGNIYDNPGILNDH